MNFYRVYDHRDPADTDTFFTNKREAEQMNTRISREGGEPSGVQTLTWKGPLTKRAVCRMLHDWPMR